MVALSRPGASPSRCCPRSAPLSVLSRSSLFTALSCVVLVSALLSFLPAKALQNQSLDSSELERPATHDAGKLRDGESETAYSYPSRVLGSGDKVIRRHGERADKRLESAQELTEASGGRGSIAKELKKKKNARASECSAPQWVKPPGNEEQSSSKLAEVSPDGELQSPTRRLRDESEKERLSPVEPEDAEGGLVRYKQISKNAEPYSVRVEGRFLRLGGRKTLLLAAGMSSYFFYSEGSDWTTFLRNARAAGCNAVHTTVVWGAHEQTPNVFDFMRPSTNLVKFAQLAAANDLFLILNIWSAPERKPEWKNAGLPVWLDVSLRDPFEDAKKATRRRRARLRKWLRVLRRILKPLSASEGGPLILLQVESSLEFPFFVKDTVSTPAISSSEEGGAWRELTGQDVRPGVSSVDEEIDEGNECVDELEGEEPQLRHLADSDGAFKRIREAAGDAEDLAGRTRRPRRLDLGPQVSHAGRDSRESRRSFWGWLSAWGRKGNPGAVKSGEETANSGERTSSGIDREREESPGDQKRLGTTRLIWRQCSPARILSTLNLRRQETALARGETEESPEKFGGKTTGDQRRAAAAASETDAPRPSAHRANKFLRCEHREVEAEDSRGSADRRSSVSREETEGEENEENSLRAVLWSGKRIRTCRVRPMPAWGLGPRYWRRDPYLRACQVLGLEESSEGAGREMENVSGDARAGGIGASDKRPRNQQEGAHRVERRQVETQLHSGPWEAAGGARRTEESEGHPQRGDGVDWNEGRRGDRTSFGRECRCSDSESERDEDAWARDFHLFRQMENTRSRRSQKRLEHYGLDHRALVAHGAEAGGDAPGLPRSSCSEHSTYRLSAERTDIRMQAPSAVQGDSWSDLCRQHLQEAPQRRRSLWEELDGLQLPLVYSVSLAGSGDVHRDKLMTKAVLDTVRDAELSLRGQLLLGCSGKVCAPPRGGIRGLPGSRARSRAFLLGKKRRERETAAGTNESLGDLFWRHCFLSSVPCVWLEAPPMSPAFFDLLSHSNKESVSLRSLLGLRPQLSEDVLAVLQAAPPSDRSGISEASSASDGSLLDASYRWARFLRLFEWSTLSAFVMSLWRGQPPSLPPSLNEVQLPPFSSASAGAFSPEQASHERGHREANTFTAIPVDALQDALRFFAYGGTVLSHIPFIEQNPALTDFDFLGEATSHATGQPRLMELPSAASSSSFSSSSSSSCVSPGERSGTEARCVPPASSQLLSLGPEEETGAVRKALTFDGRRRGLAPLNVWGSPQTPLFEVLFLLHRFIDHASKNFLERPSYTLPSLHRAHVELFPFRDVDVVCNTHEKRTLTLPARDRKVPLSPRSCYGYARVPGSSASEAPENRQVRLIYSTALYRRNPLKRRRSVEASGQAASLATGLPVRTPWSKCEVDRLPQFSVAPNADLFAIADGTRLLKPQAWVQSMQTLEPMAHATAVASALSEGPAFCLRDDSPAKTFVGNLSVLAFPQQLANGWSDFVWYEVDLLGPFKDAANDGLSNRPTSVAKGNALRMPTAKPGVLAVRCTEGSSSIYVFSEQGDLLGQKRVSDVRGSRWLSARSPEKKDEVSSNEIWLRVQVPSGVRRVVILSSSFGARNRRPALIQSSSLPSWRSRVHRLVCRFFAHVENLCRWRAKTRTTLRFPRTEQQQPSRQELLWQSIPVEPTKRCIGFRREPQLQAGVALNAFLDMWGFEPAPEQPWTRDGTAAEKPWTSTPSMHTGQGGDGGHADGTEEAAMRSVGDRRRNSINNLFQWSLFVFGMPRGRRRGFYHVLKITSATRTSATRHRHQGRTKNCCNDRRGRAYVNSQFAGYYLINGSCTDRTTSDPECESTAARIKIPTDWVKPGLNYIDLLEEEGGYGGGVTIQEVRIH
ncbi:glycosyl hydrolases family 35 protein [Toxoplasma gondii CAST]|uniref:Glycosyl hydrolases family 35 protein n=1 Tax=Toxoplasma gondii CAST TaxID=943122 RepID=A0A3R8AHG8_TOXGO|nr:glycosyl hydrolases family 35 protein [Toxoplasma gondii CAST]